MVPTSWRALRQPCHLPWRPPHALGQEASAISPWGSSSVAECRLATWFARSACALQEGKAASLAADFSITQFRHVGRLLMVHGRSSYKRSAALGQFVMHRGLIISTMQGCRQQERHGAQTCRWGGEGLWLTLSCPLSKAVFSSVCYFASVPLYQGFLMVG